MKALGVKVKNKNGKAEIAEREDESASVEESADVDAFSQQSGNAVGVGKKKSKDGGKQTNTIM